MTNAASELANDAADIADMEVNQVKRGKISRAEAFPTPSDG